MDGMNKGILHGTIIFAGMVIAYYGIRSMHQPMETSTSIMNCIDAEAQINDSRATIERRIELNKKLLVNYQNEVRDLQKLGLSANSLNVQFSQRKAVETAALINNLEQQVKATE